MPKNRPKWFATTSFASTLALALVSCGGDETSSTAVTTVTPTPTPTPTTSANQATLQPASFVEAGLASSITTVDCTLSGGTATTCFRIVSIGAPSDHDVGSFCPRNISDAGAGMWIENNQTYDLSGAFIQNLATFYNDSQWQMFDTATGNIFVTDTQVAFEAAAQPQVPAQYNNHCVEGEMSYVGGGVSQTYLIPTTPVPLASAGAIGRDGVGVGLNGINIAPPAPVANILAAYTIAAFDDCGGHINPTAGYHYHAATGCTSRVVSSDGHADLFGYALDGYGIYAQTDAQGMEPTDLDNCRGHSDDTRGYHYHAAAPGENMHIGCFAGEQGSIS